MSDFHQSNRIINEKHRRELFDHVAKLACPENFCNSKITDTKKFYLGFESSVAPIINTEIKRLKKDLAKTNNSHLLLLKITALVDAIIRAAFDASIWFHNRTLKKKLRPENVPIAIIARGGYGREEIYFLSNLDVQIISGKDQTKERLNRVLTNDPGLGVARHVDAGYSKAIKTAKDRNLDIPVKE